ncbi:MULTISPECIES: ATP-dependent DNA helicase DinG [Listeria]|uniref:ATP-dependent DNA helicase DinG n=1 Tax=Listeria TaxID=1637 RepID=UPI000B58CBAD|nr:MULTISPECIES: ATP-dependent DNA helicase DinG [Listeria]
MGRKLKKYVVVDLETTGNQASRDDRIIQFAATLVEGKQIVETFSTYINPLKPVPPFIQELTGITPDDLSDAPLFEDVADTILALLDDTIFVAHNVNFDWTFLQKEMRRAGRPLSKMKLLDTVEMARILYPSVDSYKLQDLADEFGFIHENPHKADSDALVTAELFLQCVEKLESLPVSVIRKMTTIAQPLKTHLPELFFEIEMKKDRQAEPLPEKWLEHRGLVLRKKNIRKPIYRTEDKLDFPKSEEEKLALFKRAGAPLYARSGQFEMMNLAFQAMQTGRHALIEAGTGIGKSLGYFLPSIYFAKQKELPVIISTYTNLLQTQLYEKDVPLVSKLTGFDVQASLLKGRDHYLNLFKFEQLLHESDPQYDVVVTKLKLLVWLTETETGDIDEVNLSSGGELFWNRMKHTGWYLSETKDPWIAFDFYKFSLEQARHADLVIVNHALLLSDHFNGKKLLPAYSFAVIDEAHHFAESARMQKSFYLSYRKVKYFLNQLGTLEKYSLLSRLEMVFPAEESLFDLDIAQLKLTEATDILFSLLHAELLNSRGAKKELVLIENEQKIHFDDTLKYAAENVLVLFREVERNIETLLKKGKQEETDLKEAETAFVEEVYSFLLDWKTMREDFACLLNENQPVMTISLEADKNGALPSLRIVGTLMEVERALQEDFFEQKESVILTSATLSVNHDFSYIKKALGLEESDLLEAKIPSPFQYEENARILIPQDMPQIKGTPVSDYAKALADYLSDVALCTDGRMLVLFTATEMLRETLRFMKGKEALAEYMILAQGVSAGSPARLTKQFQLFEKAILLGTTSFWEGIDIPGEDLSCLAIVRLPFAPLEDPYTKAQIALRKERGENAFQTYSLPEAVLRFKQGFGRLIRRETDRGIILVFDNRIDTTKFGQSFLNSIPKVPTKKGDKTVLLSEIADFFKSE